MDLRENVNLVHEARKMAYAKHSGYTVGAILTTKSGKKYMGCNIENNGIQSICAERVAFCKAISEGEMEFESVVVTGGPKDKDAEKCLPCGYCRQFMSEFVDKNFKVYSVYENKVDEYTMEELLPHSFEL